MTTSRVNRLSGVTAPQDVLARDVVLWPDWVGMAPNYDESTSIYMLRVWGYLQENEIDTSDFRTAGELDDEYGPDLQRLAGELGLSMNQFAAAAGTAMHIHESGFHDWYDHFNDARVSEWAPTDSFEWTHERHLEDQIAIMGEESAVEMFEHILSERSSDEIVSDDELWTIAGLLVELTE